MSELPDLKKPVEVEVEEVEDEAKFTAGPFQVKDGYAGPFKVVGDHAGPYPVLPAKKKPKPE